ncbi:MAG: ATP-dependent DNA helicase RecG [Planctomycetes bacterium]|nr:ATP-dependent DNA helicase RecG [Planctomycetota bacterium]
MSRSGPPAKPSTEPTRELPGTPGRALDQALSSLRGVGPARAAAFAAAGLQTVRDLLLHLPTKFTPLPHPQPTARLEPGKDAAVVGRVTRIVPSRRRQGATRVDVEDDRGTVSLVFFHQPHVGSAFTRGAFVYALGRVGVRDGKTFLAVGHYEFVAALDSGRPAAALPAYVLPDAVPPRLHRRLVRDLARTLAVELDDWRAASDLPGAAVLPLGRAIAAIHECADEVELDAARRRLAYDEFVHHLRPLIAARAQVERTTKPDVVRVDADEFERLRAALPFALTRAQRRVLDEVFADLARGTPMHRLLHGDVGSGKTAVALLAAAAVVRAKHQAALLAPTALLADQHERTARRILEPLGVPFASLTAATPARARKELAARLESGEPLLLIGTHALLVERVKIPKLRLAVVDEQHRFGVQQRGRLRAKASAVDLLVMSATPIPRTLALAVFGDLEVSALDEMPPGRTPVATSVRERRELKTVADDIRDVARAGGRVFVVCPLVAESEQQDLIAAETLAKKLAAYFKGSPAVGLAHGRRKPEENAAALAAFQAGRVPVLVSTLVVEVGVDVPEATLMVVVDAARFGLAALHQLRGRVGRGARASRCILVAKDDKPESRERLDVLVDEHDGLVIAQKDLEVRGPGQIAGSRQHGVLDFGFADLARDVDLLAQAQQDLRRLLEATDARAIEHALRSSPPALRERLATTASVGPG